MQNVSYESPKGFTGVDYLLDPPTRLRESPHMVHEFRRIPTTVGYFPLIRFREVRGDENQKEVFAFERYLFGRFLALDHVAKLLSPIDTNFIIVE